MSTHLQFAVLHATRGRPDKAIAAMRLWYDRGRSDGAEYIVATTYGDPTVPAMWTRMCQDPEWWFRSKLVECDSGGSARAWNEAYLESKAPLLFQMSDDVEPPENYFDKVLERLPDDWRDRPIVVAVSDGYRMDRLLTSFICTRKYAELAGHFVPPMYPSVWSDDELTARAYQRQRDGLATLIEARDLVFRHRHHAADPTVPEDDVYRWQNRPEAYALGEKLFRERNPAALLEHALWK